MFRVENSHLASGKIGKKLKNIFAKAFVDIYGTLGQGTKPAAIFGRISILVQAVALFYPPETSKI